MSIIIKEGVKSTLINYIGAFIGFLSTTFIIVALLSPEIIGLTRVILEAAIILSTFMQIGITSSAIKFFPLLKTKDGKNKGFFFYLISIPVIGAIIFIPLFLFLSPHIIEYFSAKSALFNQYYEWIIPLSLFLVYIGVFEVYANVLMKISVPKFIKEILIRLLHISIYILYALDLVTLNQFISLFVLVFAIAGLANLFYIRKIGNISLSHNISDISKPIRKDFTRYTLFLMLGVLGGSITSRIDLFMVTGEMGLDYGGIYSIAFYIIVIMEIPYRSIASISAPIASEAIQAGNIERVNKLYKNVSINQLLIGGGIFILLWANIDNIFNIIPNGDIYKTGKYVILFLGIARLFTLFLGFGHILISYSKYYAWTLTFTFIITAITVISNYYLIPIFGITGAAIGTLISTSSSLLLQQYVVFKKLRCNPYSKNSIKVILILSSIFLLNQAIPYFGNPWIDGIIRSTILLIILFTLIYFSKPSEELNKLIIGFKNYFLSLLLNKPNN